MNNNILQLRAKQCRYDILRMIRAAGSGHTGGSLSSVDLYVTLLDRMTPDDRLVVSHGHSAAALYAALANYGYVDVEEAVASFRRKPPFEGHPSLAVNGVEWCSGSLGQGLSVGCGFALAKKLKGENGRVFVVMGDGEQQKGQLQEAREFAVNYALDNLIAVVDDNGLQACGTVADTTNASLEKKYAMSGWQTVSVDGHDLTALGNAVDTAVGPACILAKTVMGKGVPAIENDYHYHGVPLMGDACEEALARLALSDEEKAQLPPVSPRKAAQYDAVTVPVGEGRVYTGTNDIRSAMGNALADAAAANPAVTMAALDCDLEGSVKLTDFKHLRPTQFIECGIAEHNAATVAAALSKSGVLAIHADFSMFNIAETYSQNRMADINHAPFKLFCTHAGLDVGEDGKTHQCIDYVSLLANLHGMQIIVPADANQADGAVRYALATPHPVAVIGGRSKLPILADKEGTTLGFVYGKGDWLREGADGVIVAYGNLVHHAVRAADALAEKGVRIGVLNMATPAALDEEALKQAATTGLIVTYEDHNVQTGIAGGVARLLCENGIACRLVAKGVSHYGASMSPDRLYEEQGLDEASLINEILNIKENAVCKQ